MNFRYKLMQFMSGRYGPDKLMYATLGISVCLAFVNLFVRAFGGFKAYLIIQLFVYAFLALTLFRFFSRNISKRARENEKFRNALAFAKRRRELYNQRKADECHVYRKCPRCKATLRLPHRLGKHKTVCPRCNTEFTVKVKK